MKHKNLKVKLGLLLFFACISLFPTWAQQLSVSGTVVDEKAEPVIGASILVKGTNRGMITDVNGKFQLSDVRSSDVLVVSFVGMQTQEVKAKERLHIVLTSTSEELDEDWCSEELIGTVDVTARTITFQPQTLGAYYTFAQETDEQAPVVATVAEDGTIQIKGWGAWYGGYTYIEGAQTQLSKQ